MVNVDLDDSVGILRDACTDKFDNVVLGTIDSAPQTGVEISEYDGLWKFVLNLLIR
jgi:hypothetical protein